MTKGQSFYTQNAYRVAFYDEVIKMAHEVNLSVFTIIYIFQVHTMLLRQSESESKLPRYVTDGDEVKKIGHMLYQFIDPHSVLYSIEGPRRPLVIISFDESHILTNNPRGTVWNLFSKLCHVFSRDR